MGKKREENGASHLLLYVVRRFRTRECLTPDKRLIRFPKVSLKPGETRRLEFSIPAAEDGFIKLRGKFQVK